MKFKQLPGSQLPSDEILEAINKLSSIFNDYFEPVADSDNSCRIKECKTKPCCLLDLFYFYDPTLVNRPAYRNGIWIQVNKKDVWLYVHVNVHKRKKVSITSGSDLGCKSFPQIRSGYICLPPSFSGPFAYYENLRVQNIAYTNLLNAIIKRLPCVCGA